MTACAVVLVMLMLGMSVPAWAIARQRGKGTPLLLLLPLPAILAWVALSTGGYGAQSLSNLVEPLIILLAGVALAYVYLLVMNRTDRSQHVIALLLMAALILLAFLLRTFMPILPE